MTRFGYTAAGHRAYELEAGRQRLFVGDLYEQARDGPGVEHVYRVPGELGELLEVRRYEPRGWEP